MGLRRRREARAGWELPGTVGALQPRRREAVDGHGRRARDPGVAELPEARRRHEPRALDRRGGEVRCTGLGEILWWWNTRAQGAQALGQAGHETGREGRVGILHEARVQRVEVAILRRGRLLAVANLFGRGGRGGIVRHRGEAGWGRCRVGVLTMPGGDGRYRRWSEGWDVAAAGVRLRGRRWDLGLG